MRKADSAVVGSIAFKKPPRDGVIEVGYGLVDEFTKNGYMTEALKALIKAGYELIAETEAGNTASERVLMRCGFAVYEKIGENSWWKLKN